MVAPAYHQDSYIDHELSVNLDSTFAFEGPEKLLEIWFYEENECLNNEGLRSIKLEDWKKILDLVNCKVLSMKSSKYMDAYLLSESSLFVFPHKLILKTCGTTTTLACLDELFKLIGMSSKSIYKIFYSRRSFMFPDKQIHVHKDWKSEVNLLDKFFINGKSYVVGNYNSDDHWYLYVGGELNDDSNDQSFEILMTDLDSKCSEKFMNNPNHIDGHETGLKILTNCGLDSIFSKISHLLSPRNSDDEDEEPISTFVHDAFGFNPCGFSSNSIDNNGYYYTLHVTPESGWSYASFESNVPLQNLEIVKKVLDVFQPSRFSINLIQSNSEPICNLLYKSESFFRKWGYKKNEKVNYDLVNHDLFYLHYEKV
ncbi:unnamed protein product [Candida verbasci]|uniref:S-adenosylmethionine decarboxylase proenzyme n=1 Tax=Candida verbasci TaxID=1227364 RepID=A0A9W4XIB6_9ASCO|nr:unnamed protein product [Candida verbasci]